MGTSVAAPGRTDPQGQAAVNGRRLHIRGTVQGVGFRPWVYRLARQAGVTGRVWNDSSGVTIEAFGTPEALAAFEVALGGDAPPAAVIAEVLTVEIPAEPASDFVIELSENGAGKSVSIPPDLATCPDCLAEILDPTNRRYRYAFTNCTNCGPRFTIATDIPYDRRATTMAAFEMCPACRREYEDPGNRRFHAQPNACPDCGPRLTLIGGDGLAIPTDDPVAAAARLLIAGQIVALKGIGGFHLACDATSPEAVARLRERKRRDEKPFAVMVADLAQAETLAALDDEARRLLTSPERSIVLVPARHTPALASNVAPRNHLVGLFLPYTPLHHLLLNDTGRPLVMTSGNVSDEPIAFENIDAINRLSSIADVLLIHDRDIRARCDDSVVGLIGGTGVLFRRSRGYVPRPLPVTRRFARPVLACGALLKNTFCLADGDRLWLGPHVGDLENVETYESYRDAIERMERFVQVEPDVIAHDLHPDYLSTRYARGRPERHRVAVQHHHAHVVSAMAEHGIDGRAIGIAYDGTGLGTDGTLWGGEVMVAGAAAFLHAGTFRTIPLVGGDQAIRQPWRIALALVRDAFGDTLPAPLGRLLPDVERRDLRGVEALLASGLNTPLARGIGRYFDGFGALVLGRPVASFEGQIAMEWNQAAGDAQADAYPYAIDVNEDELATVDLRAATRAAVHDLLGGRERARISAAFHATIAAATAELVRRAAARHGRDLPVVASGGCLQNARLAEAIRSALAPEHRVLLHEQVPPGDGGIAVGQAIVADAITRGV